MPEHLKGPGDWAILDKKLGRLVSFTSSEAIAEKYHSLGYRVVPSSQVA